jgi:hypothetical protein
MLAERFFLQTDREGRVSGLPVFAANEEIEVIVLRKEAVSQDALEQAYQAASIENDPAWEAVVADGLDYETR